MTTVSPSLGWTACIAPHAVVPATNRPPAASHETFSGLRARSPASTRTSSAWEARLSENPITSSPGENPPTPAPTSDDPGEVAALPGRERRREQLRHRPRADDRLSGVDAGRLHPYEDLPVPGHRAFHLVNPQHVDPAELVVPDCLWHDLCISLQLEFAVGIRSWNSPGSTPGGLAHVTPLLKSPAGRRATPRLAARQVRRRHRIMVIRATGAPQNRSSADSRACAGSGQPLPSP